MKILKLYLISIILNSLPIVVAFLFLSMTIGVERMRGDQNIGFYIYGAFFIAASIINLSFFLLKIKFIRKNKVTNFLSSYLSSLFFLIISVCMFSILLSTEISAFGFRIQDIAYCIIDNLFYLVYFFINFFLVLIYRIKTKKEGKKE